MGEKLAAPVITTKKRSDEDLSGAQVATVAVDDLRVFSQATASAAQIATLKKGETVNLVEPLYGQETSGKGTVVWSKVSVGTSKDDQLVGYIRDAVTADEYSHYDVSKYIIKLKPANADEILAGKVSVVSVGGNDLSITISLKEAIESQSSSDPNQPAPSQFLVKVEIHNYIEGASSSNEASRLAFVRALQIRKALIEAGVGQKNINIIVPPEFLVGKEGSPDYDKVTIFVTK
jgi:hypothetical protein